MKPKIVEFLCLSIGLYTDKKKRSSISFRVEMHLLSHLDCGSISVRLFPFLDEFNLIKGDKTLLKQWFSAEIDPTIIRDHHFNSIPDEKKTVQLRGKSPPMWLVGGGVGRGGYTFLKSRTLFPTVSAVAWFYFQTTKSDIKTFTLFPQIYLSPPYPPN